MTFELNPNAKPFYPCSYLKDQEAWNKLEQDFIKNNKWIFEDELFDDSETSNTKNNKINKKNPKTI